MTRCRTSHFLHCINYQLDFRNVLFWDKLYCLIIIKWSSFFLGRRSCYWNRRYASLGGVGLHSSSVCLQNATWNEFPWRGSSFNELLDCLLTAVPDRSPAGWSIRHCSFCWWRSGTYWFIGTVCTLAPLDGGCAKLMLGQSVIPKQLEWNKSENRIYK